MYVQKGRAREFKDMDQTCSFPLEKDAVEELAHVGSANFELEKHLCLDALQAETIFRQAISVSHEAFKDFRDIYKIVIQGSVALVSKQHCNRSFFFGSQRLCSDWGISDSSPELVGGNCRLAN